MKLVIDGVEIAEREWHVYAIRFRRQAVEGTADEAIAIPVLYQDGKRVTKAWQLELNESIPADEHGGNANTA